MDAREATRLAPTEPPRMMMGPGAAAFGGGMQNNPAFMAPHSASGMMQGGMRLPFNAGAPSVQKPAAEAAEYEASSTAVMRPCGGFNLTEPVKKKRGRPRKYGLDGNVALALNTSPLSPASGSAGYSGAPSSAGSGKRKGRPPGSGKKQQMEALGAAGASFIPHVITVKAGEDVASKIMSFSQQGSRTVCILSANGAVSNVTLRQPATSGGTVTYEGRFEILSLSGSFMLTENGGTRSRSGGLSVALAGTDGRVLGGGVAGMLLAAAPVQVIVGSFISEVKKPALELANHDLSSATPQMSAMGFTVAPSPPSQGTSSGSSDEDGSPSNQTPGAGYSTSQPLQHVSGYNPVGWVGAHLVNQHRHEAK